MNKVDRRVVKSEQKINGALLGLLKNSKRRFNIRPIDLCRKAHVSSATFYRHYKNVDEVLGALVDEAKNEFGRIARVGIMDDAQSGWEKIILFIYRNRILFEMLWRVGDLRFVEWMLKGVEEEIVGYWPNYRQEKIDKIFGLFTHEVVAIIWLWAELGFDQKYLEEIIGETSRLMRSAGKRLGGL